MTPDQKTAVLKTMNETRERWAGVLAQAQEDHARHAAQAEDALRRIGLAAAYVNGLDATAAMVVAELDTPNGLAGLDPEPEPISRDELLRRWADRLAASYRPRDAEAPADATFGRGPESWLAVAALLWELGDTVLLHEHELRQVYFGGNPPIDFVNANPKIIAAWTRVLEECRAIVREQRGDA